MKDIYVKFSGTELQGDSTDDAHANQIEVSSFVHKILQPKSSTASSAGGHTAERTEHGEMFFTKDIDRATPKLLQACSAGTSYASCEIEFFRAYGGRNQTSTAGGAGKSRVMYLKVILSDVIVSSVDVAVTDGELPAETFGLKYGKIIWEYKQHKLDGTSTSTGKAGWDLKLNKVATA